MESRLQYHEKEIKLFDSISKESVDFISNNCDINDTMLLKTRLNHRQIGDENLFGLNDSRCVVISVLLAFQNLDISQINHNKNNPIRVNNGGF